MQLERGHITRKISSSGDGCSRADGRVCKATHSSYGRSDCIKASVSNGNKPSEYASSGGCSNGAIPSAGTSGVGNLIVVRFGICKVCHSFLVIVSKEKGGELSPSPFFKEPTNEPIFSCKSW